MGLTRRAVVTVSLGTSWMATLCLAGPAQSEFMVPLDDVITTGPEGSRPEGSRHVLGEQKTLVILANFRSQDQPYTPGFIRDLVFNKVSGYFREVSFHQAWLTGRVMGWFTLPSSLLDNGCPQNLMVREMLLAADGSDPKLDFNDYSRLVLIFANSPGTLAYQRCVGLANGTLGKESFWTPDGTILASVAYLPAIYLAVTHEMGHNFGLHHSAALECPQATLASRFIGNFERAQELCNGSLRLHGTGCTMDPYGDPFGVMGQGGGHFTPEQKAHLGWIPAEEVITLGSVPGTFTVTVHPLELPGANLLKILKQVRSPSGTHFWYTVDNREAVGLDSVYGDSAIFPHAVSGALIRFSGEYGGSAILLDATPSQTSSPFPTCRFTKTALPLGETFTDPTGIRITPKRNIGRDLEVEVAIPSQNAAPQPAFIDLNDGEIVYGGVLLRCAIFDDRDLIDRVRFFKDGQLLAEVTIADLTRNVPVGQTPSEFRLSWNTRSEINGSRHRLTVRAEDSAGLEGEESIVVSVDNSGPRPTIVSPKPNEVVRGVVTVDVEVQIPDYIGRLQSVSLFANGVSVGQDSVAPYTFQWDTTYQLNGKPFWPDGSYTLSAAASSWDGRVHGTSHPVPVIVDNVPDGYGDIDGDGRVRLSDAIGVLRAAVGRDPLPAPTDPMLQRMDVNCDGRVTVSGDFIPILQTVVGRRTLPAGSCRG